jgi:ADP-ribose pyrophosphatase
MENDQDRFFQNETVSLPRKIESHGILYEDPYKKIERITAEFEGFRKEYFVSDCGEKAAVLLICDDRLLLVRQYRLFVNGLSFEIPAGRVDEDESPEDAAARECFEETGVACGDLRPLISYDVDLECVRNHTYVFLSQAADAGKSGLAKNHVWIPFGECLAMVFDGRISDSLSIISILAYHTSMTKSV